VEGRERLTAAPEALRDPRVLADLYFHREHDKAA
jgi:hypothetical protein